MTKNSVLAVLLRSDDYVSGEKISEDLGMWGTAVNIAVKSLRKDGCTILSSTRKGYLLTSAPDRLTPGDLSAFLTTDRMKSVQCLDCVSSTNKLLHDMAYEGAPDGQVVVANEQTGGRGRMGRTFYSPADQGIYLSMLLRPEGLPADATALTAWAAVAICNAIESVCGIRPGIKWVNDLVMNGHKICGILTEMSVESETGRIQYVMIGAGINVNEEPRDFPEELQSVASSIRTVTGKCCSRAQLAAEIICEMDRLRFAWPAGHADYLEAYRRDSVVTGREITVLSGTSAQNAVADRINDDFSLSVHFEDGHQDRLTAGEVSIRGIYAPDHSFINTSYTLSSS